jgi:hypothetical protein
VIASRISRWSSGQTPPAATHAARAARHRWCAQVGRHGSSAGQSDGAQVSTSKSTSSGGGSGPACPLIANPLQHSRIRPRLMKSHTVVRSQHAAIAVDRHRLAPLRHALAIPASVGGALRLQADRRHRCREVGRNLLVQAGYRSLSQTQLSRDLKLRRRALALFVRRRQFNAPVQAAQIMPSTSISAADQTSSRPELFEDAANSSFSAARSCCAAPLFAAITMLRSLHGPGPASCGNACASESRVSAMWRCDHHTPSPPPPS